MHDESWMMFDGVVKSTSKRPNANSRIPRHTFEDLSQLIQPLVQSQGPSQLHGYGPWLVCEGSLNASPQLIGRLPLNGFLRIHYINKKPQPSDPKKDKRKPNCQLIRMQGKC